VTIVTVLEFACNVLKGIDLIGTIGSSSVNHDKKGTLILAKNLSEFEYL